MVHVRETFTVHPTLTTAPMTRHAARPSVQSKNTTARGLAHSNVDPDVLAAFMESYLSKVKIEVEARIILPDRSTLELPVVQASKPEMSHSHSMHSHSMKSHSMGHSRRQRVGPLRGLGRLLFGGRARRSMSHGHSMSGG